MKKLISLVIISFSVNAFAQIPTIGLVAFYAFNGNANDTSGNGHHGTVHGAALTTDRFGNPNSAYYFDGSAYIQVPNANELNLVSDKTISAWTYVSASDAASLPWYPTIFYKNTAFPSYVTYALQLNEYIGYGSNRYKYDFLFGVSTTNYQCNSAQLYTSLIDQWVCVTGTYSISTGIMKIYINGILSNSLFVGTETLSNSSTYDLYIGMCDMSNCHFIGKIDEAAIYNRALSDQEVADLCNETAGITEAQAKINNLTIYPDPSSDQITIDAPTDAAAEIINSQGQIIRVFSIKNASQHLDLSDLPKGVYIIKATTKKEIIIKQFIKL